MLLVSFWLLCRFEVRLSGKVGAQVMSRLYTPDGEIRQDIGVRETAGGGRNSFKVNEWTGES